MDKAPSKGLVSSSVNNDSNLKRKINESNSDDDDAEVFKHKPSETDLNKKLKQINKPTKIQVNLASSGLKASLTLKSKTPIIETNKQTIIETEKLKPINAKLPTGNLAPSNNKQTVLLKNVSEKVAKVFGSDDDDDNDREEMPLEAKMKMKNVGRNTPTSQGPNSYGKTILGFCDSRKLFEKQLKEKADQLLREEESEANK